MIKHILTTAVVLVILCLATRCQSTRHESSDHATQAQNDSTLYASLVSEERYALEGPIMITFTVTNPTDDTLTFTQYHTPFEGMISKFLRVKDSADNEVDYIGAMARRVMPPPADTYHAVAPGATKSVSFDLKKGYAINQAGPYTLQYEGEIISGIASGRPIVITVEPSTEASVDDNLIIMRSEDASRSY